MMTSAIVNERNMEMGKYAGLNPEQLEKFYTFIAGAVPCPSFGVAPDVYSQQVARAAVRAARSPEKLDSTDRMILGLAPVAAKPKTTAAERNPCTRCGGVGTGNWGQVRNGVCFKCGGSGVNPSKA